MKIKINAKSLLKAMEARNLSFEEVSNRTHIDQDRLLDIIEGRDSPNKGQFSILAKSLAVSKLSLVRSETPSFDFDIADFRTAENRRAVVGPEAAAAIQRAEKIQYYARSIKGYFDGVLPTPKIEQASIDDNVKLLAEHWRKRLSFSVDLQIAKAYVKGGKPTTNYLYLRTRIEDFGIFVLQQKYPWTDSRGFALCSEDVPPVIVINSEDATNGAKTFTLLHEFCHCLLGKSGISDPQVTENKVEKFCNEFAAEFLMPENLIYGTIHRFQRGQIPTYDEIRKFAATLEVSQQALVIRLTKLGIVPSEYYGHWIAQFHRTQKTTSGFVPHPTKKLGELGVSLVDFAIKAVDGRAIDPIETYQLTGVRPRDIHDLREEVRQRREKVYSIDQ